MCGFQDVATVNAGCCMWFLGSCYTIWSLGHCGQFVWGYQIVSCGCKGDVRVRITKVLWVVSRELLQQGVVAGFQEDATVIFNQGVVGCLQGAYSGCSGVVDSFYRAATVINYQGVVANFQEDATVIVNQGIVGCLQGVSKWLLG